MGPYKIVKKISNRAYQLDLPPELAGVHHVFHVSQLRRCLKRTEKPLPMDTLDLQETWEYAEHPVRILDRAVKETRNTKTPFCKVVWSNHTEREATWEKESDRKKLYPYLFEG